MNLASLLIAAASALTAQAAFAGVYPQCPFDITAASVTARDRRGHRADAAFAPAWPRRRTGRPHRQVCLHVVGRRRLDGADGSGAQTYGFGFAPAEGSRRAGDDQRHLERSSPRRRSRFRQDDEVWLSLTNVGMIHRPDLFDQHSVHWHGFPQASAIFDGVPQASATVQMGSTFTYY